MDRKMIHGKPRTHSTVRRCFESSIVQLRTPRNARARRHYIHQGKEEAHREQAGEGEEEEEDLDMTPVGQKRPGGMSARAPKVRKTTSRGDSQGDSCAPKQLFAAHLISVQPELGKHSPASSVPHCLELGPHVVVELAAVVVSLGQ